MYNWGNFNVAHFPMSKGTLVSSEMSSTLWIFPMSTYLCNEKHFKVHQ